MSKHVRVCHTCRSATAKTSNGTGRLSTWGLSGLLPARPRPPGAPPALRPSGASGPGGRCCRPGAAPPAAAPPACGSRRPPAPAAAGPAPRRAARRGPRATAQPCNRHLVTRSLGFRLALKCGLICLSAPYPPGPTTVNLCPLAGGGGVVGLGVLTKKGVFRPGVSGWTRGLKKDRGLAKALKRWSPTWGVQTYGGSRPPRGGGSLLTFKKPVNHVLRTGPPFPGGHPPWTLGKK